MIKRESNTDVERKPIFVLCICVIALVLFPMYNSNARVSVCAVYFNITRPLVPWECYYRTRPARKGAGKKAQHASERCS